MKVLFLITFSLFLGGCLADYCAVCADHIACLNRDRLWAATCPADAQLITLDDTLIYHFVHNHNRNRHLVSLGIVNGLPQAAKMMKLNWNPEMASIAELNVKQCEMKHDSCRNLLDGTGSGQNLYWAGYSGSAAPNITAHIEGSVSSWFSEYIHAVPADVHSFGSATDWYTIGHFSQLAWGDISDIGCAVSTYSGSPWNSVLIACNYGAGNWMGSPIYTVGPTASQCRAVDPMYPALCSS